MKIKILIEHIKILKIQKNDNNKSISRYLPGAVVGCAGSIQYQLVPCSFLYLSRFTGPFQCSRC